MTMTTTTDRYMKFVEKIATDEDLERKMTAIEPGNTAAILALAASQGYVFTAEELKEASREAKLLVNKESEELAESDLELVAGGSWFGRVFHKVRKAVDWIDNHLNS